MIRSKQARYIPQMSTRKVIGFDTETEQGYVKVLASSDEVIYPKRWLDIIRFLTQKKYRTTLNVFYNLHFDVGCILKSNQSLTRSIAKTGKGKANGLRFTYIPGKEFRIADNSKHAWRFYDVAQFFNAPLATVVQERLGEDPHELKGDRAKLFEMYNLETIGDYCLWDAQRTQYVTEDLLDSFYSIKLFPKRLLSWGYLARQFVLSRTDIPTIYDVPKLANRLYWEAYRGGWFDIYKRGVCDVRKFDISSAYPWALAQLPDIRHGEWKVDIDRHATLGVVKCITRPNRTAFHSIGGYGYGSIFYPMWDLPVAISMTLQEYLTYRHELKLDPVVGYMFYEDPDADRPYAKVVEELYRLKQEQKKNPAFYAAIKRLINSLYGNTAQKRPCGERWSVGGLTMPVYASEITARVRLHVRKAIGDNWRKVAAVLTDAVLMEKGGKIHTGKGLGEWELEHDLDACLNIHTGIYQFLNDPPHTRGFTRKTDLWESCVKGGPSIHVEWARPRHIKEMVVQDRIEDIGVWETVKKDISPDRTAKRLWPSPIEDVHQLLEDSQAGSPVPISVLL